MNTHDNSVINKINFDGQNILEIGCGSGVFTLKHCQHAKSILGIDTNSAAIELLKNDWPTPLRNDRFLFKTADIREITIPKEYYDIAVFSKSF